jgi:hypothetical protein
MFNSLVWLHKTQCDDSSIAQSVSFIIFTIQRKSFHHLRISFFEAIFYHPSFDTQKNISYHSTNFIERGCHGFINHIQYCIICIIHLKHIIMMILKSHHISWIDIIFNYSMILVGDERFNKYNINNIYLLNISLLWWNRPIIEEDLDISYIIKSISINQRKTIVHIIN